MTIASEIARIKTNISNAYDSAEAKGATIPEQKNSENLASCIDSIQGTGGGYSELPSYQVVNGVPQKAAFELKGTEFSDITEVPASFFNQYFKGFTGLTGVVDFSSLTTIGQEGLFGTFQGCTGLTGVDFSSLTTVGQWGLNNTFMGCTGLTGVDFSSLTTVGQWGLNNTFMGCTGLTGNIDLSSITTADGFDETFKGCTGITSVDLSSWVGNDSGNVYATEMFSGCSNLENVDFSSLRRIEGNEAFRMSFLNCSKLKYVDFSSLKNINESALWDTFEGCTSLEEIEFPALETFTDCNYSVSGTFRNCTSLKTVRFTALKTFDDECCEDTFYGCTDLKDVYFNSLLANMCHSGCLIFLMGGTNGVTVHFPSNQQSYVENFDGYPNFDGTNVTIAFDLLETS